MAPADPVERRRRDALTLVRASATWRPFAGPTGKILWEIPGSRQSTYVVTLAPNACTCPDASNSNRAGRVSGPCKHQIALGIYYTIVRAFEIHKEANPDGPWQEDVLGRKRGAAPAPAL